MRSIMKVKNYSISNLFLIVLFVMLLVGCDFLYNPYLSKGSVVDSTANKSLWTFMIYMAADNELEAAALLDINELEAAEAVSDNLRIIVLIDKNGNGETDLHKVDTIYQIENDKKNTLEIISKKLNYKGFGFNQNDNSIEIDTSSSDTLESFIDFVKAKYPSENYGLIMWGHGTGYKNSGIQKQLTKGFAVDDTSENYMSTVDFGKAIKDKGLSIIGFDTCFGMLLEIAYEIKDSAKYIIGSPSLVPASGWDYKEIFRKFSETIKKTELENEEFCKIVEKEFYNQYLEDKNIVISYIDSEKIQKIFDAFDIFAGTFAEYVNTFEIKQEVYNQIFQNVTQYKGSGYPTEIMLDMYSFVDFFSEINLEKANEIKNLLTLNDKKINLGVYFCTKLAVNTVKETKDINYLKSNFEEREDCLCFVKDGKNWVPTTGCEGSFLDKMFYINY